MKSIAEMVRELVARNRQRAGFVTAEKWLRIELGDRFHEARQRIYFVLCRSVANTHVVNVPKTRHKLA